MRTLEVPVGLISKQLTEILDQKCVTFWKAVLFVLPTLLSKQNSVSAFKINSYKTSNNFWKKSITFQFPQPRVNTANHKPLISLPFHSFWHNLHVIAVCTKGRVLGPWRGPAAPLSWKHRNLANSLTNYPVSQSDDLLTDWWLHQSVVISITRWSAALSIF